MTRPEPRGRLKADVVPDVIMMICTAGHVDHGKTELVKLLTGCNTDRLKEEQERGLTIELGFAPCFLGGNLCAGIVDVPGHEKLVRNMVAGVSGIDLAILVIAADDGIMPQTIEHVQILQLMGVRRGMVALTKTDLVAPEQVEQRTREISQFLRNTFMEDAPICPVSSKTLEGYDFFYDTLIRETDQTVKARTTGLFRMPIERAFTRKGFGTVVTGIPLAGTIRVGDEIELTPGNVRGRVRGLQRFLRDAKEGGAGQCLALNIPELSLDDAIRGRVLAQPGLMQPARIIHARITCVPGLAAPLKNAEAIRFHVGTAEEHGRIYLLDTKQLDSGQSALVSVTLAKPVAMSVGDRFIIRRMSPAATMGGGPILAVCHTERRPTKKRALEQLQQLETALEGLDILDPAAVPGRLDYLLASEYPVGGRIPELAHALQLPETTVRDAATTFADRKQVLLLDKGYCLHAQSYAALVEQVETRLRALSKQGQTLSTEISKLRGALDWPEPVWNQVIRDPRIERLMTARGDKIILSEAVADLSEADRTLMGRIIDLYNKTGFQSPRPDEVAERLNADPSATKRLLDYLYASGQLIRLSAQVALCADVFRKAQKCVVEIVQQRGTLDSAEFKHQIGSTRKYALAILDFLDTRRVTLRMGNIRKLAPGYEKNLL